MDHRAEVVLCLGSSRTHILKALRESLEAEVKHPAAPQKGRVSVDVVDYCLRVTVESPTLSGLRALLNSYLYLLHAAYAALEAASY